MTSHTSALHEIQASNLSHGIEWKGKMNTNFMLTTANLFPLEQTCFLGK